MRSFRFSLILLLIAYVLWGCGGGGGTRGCVGVATPSVMNFQTEWSGLNGNSQVIQLLTEGGTVLQSQVFNRGETQEFFASVNSGLYRVRGELRADLNGSGAVLGRFDAGIELCGSTVVRSRTSGTPTLMEVYPASLAMTVGTSQQFFAAPTNAAGEYFYSSSPSVNWSILGGGATVDAQGVVTATSVGSPTVRASDPASGAIGSATLSITSNTPTQSKWTILVFLNAANDLHPFATLNVNQMERVANNPDVRFVVQWKQSSAVFPGSTFDGTRRLLVRPDNSSAIQSPTVQNMGSGVDMGSWTTLRDFIAWGKANYPADRYGLVIWNHGNGWQRGIEPPTRAVSYDDQTGNAIQIWQLPGALAAADPEFVAWDASLMQMLEVAYEIRNETDYVIGSEESPPGEGYPYDLVFDGFRDNPDATTQSLTRGFVDGMLAVPSYASRKITQSVLRTDRLGALATSLDALAGELITAGNTVNSAVLTARTQSQSYSPTPQRTYRDLWDVADLIRTGAGVPTNVSIAALNVRNAVDAAVVWEGHNANSPRSRGIAVDFSSGATFTSIDNDYLQLQLASDTRWDNWLRIAP